MQSRFLKISIVLFLISAVPSSAFAGEALQARAEVNWRYGQDRGILMSEFWIPILQDDGSVLYGDFRMMGDDQDNREGNLGLGYRKVTSAPVLGDGVIGAHGWLDRRITQRGSRFNQVTIGAEWLGESIDVLVNGYVPLSDEREIAVPNADPQGAALVGTGIVVDTNGTVLEEPQHGFDIELGLELGTVSDFIKEHTDSLRVYGGGYYFDGPHTESVAGWRTRIATDISSDFQIGARFQRDDERGSQGFLEATIRFPFGQKKSYRREGLRARLDESPERDIDIVTNEVVTDSGDRVAVINQATGAAQEVLHIDNTAAPAGDGSAEAPFDTLANAEAAASAHTVIYLHTGAGTTNQDQGITLNKTGQQLIGAGTNFIYDSGKFTTANGVAPTSTLLIAATTAPVITNVNANSDGITVSADNIRIAGLTVDGAMRDGILIKADGGAASAQNVSISDVSAINNRFGIYVHGANGGSVSASVQNSVATANTQHGIAIYDDTAGTFNADLGGGSMGSAGRNVLAGNTLEDLAVDMDGAALFAQNNWWGQATGADTDDPSVGIAPQIYYGAPINDGLVGHWTFDSEWTTNAIAYDRSGQGNDGALQGGLSLADQVAGQNREALDFDGTDDYILIGAPASLEFSGAQDLHVTGWGQRNVLGADLILALDRDVFISGVGSTGPATSVKTTKYGVIDIFLGVVPNDLQWQNISTSWSNTGVELYLNGAFENSHPNNTSFRSSTGQPLTLGAHNIGAEGRTNGKLDDIRIYNRALSPAEISELYRMNTSSTVNATGFLTTAP